MLSQGMVTPRWVWEREKQEQKLSHGNKRWRVWTCSWAAFACSYQAQHPDASEWIQSYWGGQWDSIHVWAREIREWLLPKKTKTNQGQGYSLSPTYIKHSESQAIFPISIKASVLWSPWATYFENGSDFPVGKPLPCVLVSTFPQCTATWLSLCSTILQYSCCEKRKGRESRWAEECNEVRRS